MRQKSGSCLTTQHQKYRVCLYNKTIILFVLVVFELRYDEAYAIFRHPHKTIAKVIYLDFEKNRFFNKSNSDNMIMFIKLRLNLKLPSTILEADKIAYIQGWISPPGYRAIARWAPSGGGGGLQGTEVTLPKTVNYVESIVGRFFVIMLDIRAASLIFWQRPTTVR